MSLMKEVRNLIGPRDIDRFDMLVLKREVDAMKVGLGSLVISFSKFLLSCLLVSEKYSCLRMYEYIDCATIYSQSRLCV